MQCVIIEEVFCYASPALHWGSYCHLSHSVILHEHFLNPALKMNLFFSILFGINNCLRTWSQNAQQWNRKIWALWQVSRVCYLSSHRSVTWENVYNLSCLDYLRQQQTGGLPPRSGYEELDTTLMPPRPGQGAGAASGAEHYNRASPAPGSEAGHNPGYAGREWN